MVHKVVSCECASVMCLLNAFLACRGGVFGGTRLEKRVLDLGHQTIC